MHLEVVALMARSRNDHLQGEFSFPQWLAGGPSAEHKG